MVVDAELKNMQENYHVSDS